MRAPMPSGRKNDASSRWRLTLSVLQVETSAGRAPTSRAVPSRRRSSKPSHGDRSWNQPSTPSSAHWSSSRRSAAPAPTGCAPSDWPARYVRCRAVRVARQPEPRPEPAEQVRGVERERLRARRLERSRRAAAAAARAPGPAGSRRRGDGHAGTEATARIGNVPVPCSGAGRAVNVNPSTGSCSRPVRCSTIGMPAPSRFEWAGRAGVVHRVDVHGVDADERRALRARGGRRRPR